MAFSHAQDTRVDRRAAGVGAFALEQPGTGAVLDDGSRCREAVVRDDLSEIVTVGIGPGQRQRTGRRPAEGERGEGLENQRRARGPGSIDRRAARIDFEKTVGTVVDAARTFEAQRARGRRTAEEQVVTAIAGVRSAETARKKAVLDVRDDQRAIENLHRTRERINTSKLPDARAVLDEARVAGEVKRVAVIRDDGRKEIRISDGASRAGEGQRAHVGVDAPGHAERAGVREAECLGGINRRRSVERQPAGRTRQSAQGEQTVGRIIRRSDAIAHPLERRADGQVQIGRIVRRGADRARDTAIG